MARRFTDTRHHGCHVVSRQARNHMKLLAQDHGLSYTHNPGGGEYSKPGFRCQISGCDDVVDCEKLEAALLKHLEEQESAMAKDLSP